MTEIDRRSLMALGGAGLLVAGCGSDRRGGKVNCDDRGTSGNYGQPSTDSLPNIKKTEFTPKFLCLLYMKFDDQKRNFIVRIAYFELNITSPTDPQLAQLATPLLEEMSTDDFYSMSCYRKEEDFSRFTFYNQQIIIMFVDHLADDVSFDTRHNDNQFVVRFTSLSGQRPKDIKVKKNHAFLGLRPLTLSNSSVLKTNDSFRLNYWNTKDTGDLITGVNQNTSSTHHVYSMNIHLKMAIKRIGTGATQWVPLIVDPDTGNMGIQP